MISEFQKTTGRIATVRCRNTTATAVANALIVSKDAAYKVAMATQMSLCAHVTIHTTITTTGGASPARLGFMQYMRRMSTFMFRLMMRS